MIYETIPGYFSWEYAYKDAVTEAKDGAVFVELGTFLGKSAAYMAELIRDSGKNIRFYTVDTFNFYRSRSPEWVKQHGLEWATDKTVEDTKRNLLPLAGYVKLVHQRSWLPIEGVDIADFCWIDASHDYEDVKRDILYWVPRSRVIGGDDYIWEGVKHAVNELIPKAKKTEHWMLKPNPYFGRALG